MSLAAPTESAKPDRCQECRHHWLIEAPDGPTSDARCKRCDARRQFRNHNDGYGDHGGFLTAGERAAVTMAKREEAILTSIVKQLGGGRIAARADVPYEPPIEYGDDGTAP